MIGDRLDTDIAGAIPLGMPTAMVLTGASSQADVDNGPIKPTVIYPGAARTAAGVGHEHRLTGLMLPQMNSDQHRLRRE